MSPRKSAGPWMRGLRMLLGLALLPTGAAVLFSAAASLSGLNSTQSGARPFLAGMALTAACHLFGVLRLRRAYVFAHEFTHALAVWMGGGKVFKIVIKGDSGHVDISHSNAFVALAPYWIPLYALLIVAGYRFALWMGAPAEARTPFLALMGAALAFHFSHTAASLWTTKQSDLDEAGVVLSMSLILLLNGLVLLAAAKSLFPVAVSFSAALSRSWTVTLAFWSEARAFILRAAAAFA